MALPSHPPGPFEDQLAGLNPVQREAVIHDSGPLLIVAGAGSGKTKVLTSRVAYLITERGVSPFEILAITFTNKAADEMKHRIRLLVGPVAQKMWVSTFHSACVRILRRDGKFLGYTSNFTIYDQADAVRLTGYVLHDLDIDTKRFPPRAMHATISQAKNDLVSVKDYTARALTIFERKIADVYREYQTRLRAANAMDFDDLLVQTVELFRQCPDVLVHYQQRFKHLLVDEYQDTNAAQNEIVILLSREHRNICVVGDSDQCLPAGTLIAAPGGPRVIEEIARGDVVFGVGEGGMSAPGSVAFVKRARYRGRLWRMTAGGHVLRGTPHHVVPARRDGALSYELMGLAHIEPGMRVLVDIPPFCECSVAHMTTNPSQNGGLVEATVEAVDTEEYDGPVYDLEVTPTHVYVANGVLVHNSVYAFRGANIRNILEFENAFPDAHVIVLEQNYRSTQTILDAANAVIANNAMRKPKALWTEQVGGELINRYHAEDERDEAMWAVHEMRRLHENEHYRWGDIAVFYRTNAQSRVLEEELARRGVPYKVVGGTRFYDRREIKDLLAYLRAVVNPADEVSTKRIVNSPKRGVGDTSISRLDAWATSEAVTFREALGSAEAAGVTGKAVNGIHHLLEILADLRAAVDDNAGPGTVLELIAERTGYIRELEAEHSVESAGRLENIGELIGQARSYDDIASFLEDVSLVADTEEADPDESSVILMTLHTAKGPRVSCRVPHRHGGRRVSAPALARRARRARGGAPPLLRRDHAGARAALPHQRVVPDVVGLDAIQPAEPLPQGDSRRTCRAVRRRTHNLGRAGGRQTSGGRGMGGGRATRSSKGALRASERRSAAPAATSGAENLGLKMGDDVLHGKWGEGVIIDVIGQGEKAEAVVRFPSVGEKRLLLAWAPLKKI